jgi:hypothetical protein
MTKERIHLAVEAAKQNSSFQIKFVLCPDAEMLRVNYLLSMITSGLLVVDSDTAQRLRVVTKNRRFSVDLDREVTATLGDEFHEHAFVSLLMPALEQVEPVDPRRTFPPS